MRGMWEDLGLDHWKIGPLERFTESDPFIGDGSPLKINGVRMCICEIEGEPTKVPDSISDLEELMTKCSEFDDSKTIFHDPVFHPEGDHSLHSHMIEVFLKWKKGKPCLCHSGHHRELAFWACFFHDIGKSACASLKGDGTHSFIKHESVGSAIFKDKYSHWFSPEDSAAISFCIREHTNFWFIRKKGKLESMKEDPNFWLLAHVAVCDKMGFKDEEWLSRISQFGFESPDEYCKCSNKNNK